MGRYPFAAVRGVRTEKKTKFAEYFYQMTVQRSDLVQTGKGGQIRRGQGGTGGIKWKQQMKTGDTSIQRCEGYRSFKGPQNEGKVPFKQIRNMTCLQAEKKRKKKKSQ